MMRLTSKQKRFVEEYLIDSNGTQAAIRAGYSKKTANEQSTRLLSKVHIQQAVTEAAEKVSEEAGLTVQRIIDGMLAETKQLEDGTSATRITAWSWLGKFMRIWQDDRQADRNLNQINIQISSQDELL